MIPYGHYPFDDDFEKFFAEKKSIRFTKKIAITLTLLKKDTGGRFFYFAATTTVENENLEVRGLIYPGENHNICAVQRQEVIKNAHA